MLQTSGRLRIDSTMRVRLWIFLVVFLFPPAPVLGQEPSVEPLEIGPSGEAYLRAIRFRRVDSDVAYFDPTQPAPELSTSENPRERPQADGQGVSTSQLDDGFTLIRFFTVLISALILGVILYLFARFGGVGSLSFGQSPENTARRIRRGQTGAGDDGKAGPANLQAILRLSDRREALVALSQHLLARVVAAQGVLLQRSWTARDALRRVPRDFAHRDALQSLVMASERVQFGGRDVTEDEFKAHVERVRPIYSGREA